MKITDFFSKGSIIEELKAKNKKEALAELSHVFLQDNLTFNHEAAINILLEREKLGSTGIGEGIAIPHGKYSEINKLIISFGRSKEGADFEAMDGKPVHIFFLLMAPENTAGLHLRMLAKISRMLKDSKFRSNLMEAKSRDEIYRLIAERDDQC